VFTLNHFRKNVNKELLNRLIENQYELTDAFIQYLTHRKPDHHNGMHFILPQGGFESNPTSVNKLQKVKSAVVERTEESCLFVDEERAVRAVGHGRF
jgi:G protein-coupled receptor kinase interacting protein 2